MRGKTVCSHFSCLWTTSLGSTSICPGMPIRSELNNRHLILFFTCSKSIIAYACEFIFLSVLYTIIESTICSNNTSQGNSTCSRDCLSHKKGQVVVDLKTKHNFNMVVVFIIFYRRGEWCFSIRNPNMSWLFLVAFVFAPLT